MINYTRTRTNLVGQEITLHLKLSVFYDKCQFVSLSSDIYLNDAFVILTNQAQIYFYTNHNSIVSFEDFCQKF